jgi:hypothetical protein
MIGTIIYILTVVCFSYTVYNYLTCTESAEVTNCFDEGAEAYIGTIKSEDYDFH